MDKNIEYKSIIMPCDKVNSSAFSDLSKNFKIHYFKEGLFITPAQINELALEHPNKISPCCIGYKDISTSIKFQKIKQSAGITNFYIMKDLNKYIKFSNLI